VRTHRGGQRPGDQRPVHAWTTNWLVPRTGPGDGRPGALLAAVRVREIVSAAQVREVWPATATDGERSG
jgi:hypothetical protein